ncbi:phosphoprotein [Vesiculovirus radi]|uniref:Phosphoprotein n=1 Tax=Vesiculovirus radi TaxID=1972566 RepID=A0A0D3R1T8_9RHAB|nr:phosphoprotein [Vesiculovirus radi]AJR28593.1 phosphoprotein [Vesiculovirus radi]
MDLQRSAFEALRNYPNLENALADADESESLRDPPSPNSSQAHESEGEKFYLTDQLDLLESSDEEDEDLSTDIGSSGQHQDTYSNIDDRSASNQDEDSEEEREAYGVHFPSEKPTIDLSDLPATLQRRIFVDISNAFKKMMEAPSCQHFPVMVRGRIELIPSSDMAIHQTPSSATTPESEDLPPSPVKRDRLLDRFKIHHRSTQDPLETSFVEIFGSEDSARAAWGDGSLSYKELLILGLRRKGVFNRMRIAYDLTPIFE